MRKALLFVVLLSLFWVKATSIKAYGQETVSSLSISPPSFDLVVDKGASTSGIIKVENISGQPVQIKVEKRNISARGEEGEIDLKEEETTFSLASWITITPDLTTIPARSIKEFKYTITVPSNAEPGGHFGSVVFGTIPQKNLNQTGALFSQEIGALFLTKVNGIVNENAAIEEFKSESVFNEFGPITLAARIKNNGNVHVKPTGTIEITNLLGQKSTIQLESKNVLPNSIRKLNGTLNKTFLMGKYESKLFASYGTTNQKLVASTTFYVFPVRYAAVAFGIIAVMYLMRHRLKKAVYALVSNK